MSSLMAASMNSSAAAQAGSARYRAITAELQGQSIGAAAAQQNASERSTGLAREAQSSLVVTAPADGTIVTPDPGALLDQEVATGQPLLDMAAEGPRVVRVFVPVSSLERIRPGSQVAFELPGRFSVVRLILPQLGGDAVALPQGLIAKQDYQGIKLPVFYTARMVFPDSEVKPMLGVAGEARIFGVRRSIAGRFIASVDNLVKAHLW
jgi:hypothetical protein